MKRSRVLLAFAAGVGLAFVAVAGISRQVLRLDREGADARRREIVEENVRLALWRMDAAVSLFVARESLRPYFEFRSFVAVDRPYSDLFAPARPAEALAPSPLLLARQEHVQLYFEKEPDGTLTSPQVPPDTFLSRARQLGAEDGEISAARQTLARLRPIAASLRVPEIVDLPDRPPPPPPPPQQAAVSWRGLDINSRRIMSTSNSQSSQFYKNAGEYQSRQATSLNNDLIQSLNGDWPLPTSRHRTLEMPEGVLAPVWQDGQLLLVRSLRLGGRTYVQGCWLDWPALSRWLLDQTTDLLPNASLVAASGSQGPGERRLASLPVDLVPGALQVNDAAGGAPAWFVLVIAWVGVLVAAIAIGLLLLGALDLSERRGAFVSAVTHELRTPLTTFRMYTEMLAEGMVPSPEQQQSYIATLRREADRLSHLVENVLAYSRVEEGRAPREQEPLAIQPFLDHLVPKLAERAEQGQMRLELERITPTDGLFIAADAAAIEQILFNLVDNACKYAASASDRRLHLQLNAGRSQVAFAVRDHGPGISSAGLRKLFVPFSKSAAQAATTAPGVGLGLALCRRLARSRRGDLKYSAASGGGAVFVLTLPRARGRR